MRARRLLLLWGLLPAALGCGSDTPSFDPIPIDSGQECGFGGEADADGGESGGADGCDDGEVCLGGRCYEACESDDQCAGNETCIDGVCSLGERSDMGTDMTDAGPCGEVECPDGQVCQPSTGLCVGCLSGEDCGAAAPICDVAFGRCTAFAADVQCAPCNETLDCPGQASGEVCTDQGSERVCLAPCPADGTPCPGGFKCGADDFCVPEVGTCTQLRLAIARAPCAADTDCVPLRTPAAPGTCDTTTMQCLAVCADGISCPSGFLCDDPTDGFCR